MVKNPPVNAGDAVSVPGVEDPLEEDMETDSNSLTWEIPWNVAESDMTEHTSRRVLFPCYKRGNGGLMSQWPDTPCDHLFSSSCTRFLPPLGHWGVCAHLLDPPSPDQIQFTFQSLIKMSPS